MKKTLLQTEVKNFSRHAIDFVWENAKDLEHVAFLHANTNKAFKLLFVGSSKKSDHEYDVMVYRTKRRFYFLSFETFGFRKIVDTYQIHQIEYIPLLGITSALNSLLFRTSESNYPTLMLDEVVMEMPFWLAPLKPYFSRALKRHTAIQCSEDEPFRERRSVLKNRGIELPFSIFNQTQYSELTSLFSAKLTPSIGSSEHVASKKILVTSAH